MKVNIYSITSPLNNCDGLDEKINHLIEYIASNAHIDISIVDLKELYDGDLALILVKSGGSENFFLKDLKHLKPPFYFLTVGDNNSLAASLEIMSFLNNNNLKGEILHGSANYIASRISQLLKGEKNG